MAGAGRQPVTLTASAAQFKPLPLMGLNPLDGAPQRGVDDRIARVGSWSGPDLRMPLLSTSELERFTFPRPGRILITLGAFGELHIGSLAWLSLKLDD